MKKTISLILLISSVFCHAQDTLDFDSFRNSLLSDFSNERNSITSRYNSFRDSVNTEYVRFLNNIWIDHSSQIPLAIPIEHNPLPPKPYSEPIKDDPTSSVPKEIPAIETFPQPTPFEPIKGNNNHTAEKFDFTFFGLEESVRIPKGADITLNVSDSENIAKAWKTLCDIDMDNTIVDLLTLRGKYQLCDWAYLLLLDTVSNQFCCDMNGASLLTAFLFCQSGYQMRLAIDGNHLIMLFGSRHHIFDKEYFVVDGITFYPYGRPSGSIKICPASFEGEKPLSLNIAEEQLLGGEMSSQRNIKSYYVNGLSVNSQVPNQLISFFNDYPVSAIDGDILSRWAMYANTSLSASTKKFLYPQLSERLSGLSKLEAANKLLNWVQAGFEYEYDDKVWGHDRAFFSEETLFYPYADCEDRSILFSRLVRDLLDLGVALIYYPGHLATAVKFDTDVSGDAMIIKGERYVVCDPTYIGAPVGSQMPGLEHDKAEAIVLKK